MTLIVNGKTHDVAAVTLTELLAELQFDGGWIATAVNSELVPAAARTECRLAEGDRIEILSPRQGG